VLKQKSRQWPRFLQGGGALKSAAFDHSTDAASAHRLSNPPAIHLNSHFLEIGAKGSVSRPQRKAAIMTECRCFSTHFTLSHYSIPFDLSVTIVPQSAQRGLILP
jgi:hypothetical protein